MELIKKYPESMDKRTAFKLMNSNEAKKMSDAENSVLEVVAWVLYEDVEEKTGEVRNVISLMTADGEIFGTISNTFIREFNKIVDFFGGDVENIKVISGKSKAGRKYIACDIV